MLVTVAGGNAQSSKTHNAVSVAASGSSTATAWLDCDGFSNLAVTLINDAIKETSVDLQWSHDGTTLAGKDNNLLATATDQYRAASTRVKARYVKVQIWNRDAAGAHTISAWAYLGL